MKGNFEDMKTMQRVILGQCLWRWATVRLKTEGTMK